MSRKRNSQKRKNKDVENAGVKKQDIKLTEFPKYSILANELRHHILSYCTKSTLGKYSECSKTCDLEIQQFNTEPPTLLQIVEEPDGAVVRLFYDDFFKVKIEKKFVYSVARNTMEEVKQYLLKQYKYVTQKTTAEIQVDVRSWPADVMEIEHIRNIEQWDVTIYKSMFDDCIEYFKTNNVPVRKLSIEDCEEDCDKVYLRPEFFKTDFYKSVPRICIDMDGSIDDEDFANSRQERITSFVPVSDDAIRAIVKQWNKMVHLVGRDYIIGSDRVFDVLDIFPMNRFDISTNSRDSGYKIGKVRIYTENDDTALVLAVQKD